MLAVHQVVSEAIAWARDGHGPTLIEAVTYRLGAHTTADDPTRYRSPEEVELWAGRDPIARFRKFLMDQKMLTEAEDEALYKDVAAEIEEAVEVYEALPPPQPADQFEFVYAEPPAHLQRQRTQLLRDLGLETGSNGRHRTKSFRDQIEPAHPGRLSIEMQPIA